MIRSRDISYSYNVIKLFYVNTLQDYYSTRNLAHSEDKGACLRSSFAFNWHIKIPMRPHTRSTAQIPPPPLFL